MEIIGVMNDPAAIVDLLATVRMGTGVYFYSLVLLQTLIPFMLGLSGLIR